MLDPSKKNCDWQERKESGIGAYIRIDREIQCLPYAGFLKTEWQPDQDNYLIMKSPHKSNLFKRESISKLLGYCIVYTLHFKVVRVLYSVYFTKYTLKI